MAQVKTITLVCDSCGTEAGDVQTRTVTVEGRTLTGEACPKCWQPVAELAEHWRPRRKRRKG